MAEPIDTFNRFMVGVRGNDIVFLRPIPHIVSKKDALLLAAYLVTMAEEPDAPSFKEVLDAVLSA
jgi:hypothetical protein